MIDEDKSMAVVLYHQGGKYLASDAPVLEYFSDIEKAHDMIAYCVELMDELNNFSVDWESHTLSSGTDEYEHWLRRKHPELNDAAVKVLTFAFWRNWR